MSYTIEYNKQFIRSEQGITPVWLAGSNNVYEGPRQHMRRCREWCCFHNLLGVTEAVIIESVQASLGGYEEHWRKNGKYLNDKALLRWIHNGVAKAATIEEILHANHGQISYVQCYLSVWGVDRHLPRDLVHCCHTTEEFDAWIVAAKERITTLHAQKHDVFPIVDFGTEKLCHPSVAPEVPPEKVLLKSGKRYLSHYCGRSSTWTSDIREAQEFTWEEADNLQKDESLLSDIARARRVNAAQKLSPYNAVIRFTTGVYSGNYISSISSRHFQRTSQVQYAKHYPTTRAAERVVKRLQFAVRKYGELEVCLDPSPFE